MKSACGWGGKSVSTEVTGTARGRDLSRPVLADNSILIIWLNLNNNFLLLQDTGLVFSPSYSHVDSEMEDEILSVASLPAYILAVNTKP